VITGALSIVSGAGLAVAEGVVSNIVTASPQHAGEIYNVTSGSNCQQPAGSNLGSPLGANVLQNAAGANFLQ
jgi:hypothetical protein